ncbi:glucose 1-dehydrogenase [Bordetella holmesii]|nr:3-alpha-(or 20-beta)-hydroxysteroid dehydrogenase [Bordetella holmesii ATCC 51541]AIT25633.1 3-alpha-(or 20-beta)-hydroxysteroid dehydrogenase [Bordetella holmesii 44057]AMD44784.1 oxidoreductase [Bordetella holmesii H558]AWP68248.1 oxidoreductase [Bordetella holmesii]EWM44195.1 3-alpha-(or 20-beta)-hydroxysteroid dehydrogenase [Bordetella holmesii 41130]EWM46202.1 3-alpha-(or 20-beta)-hydroxysteroid dehydrogenase [Bordetella holmesii 35009]KAK70755.1 putative 3-alpha-(or 20-beta)-hydroxys
MIGLSAHGPTAIQVHNMSKEHMDEFSGKVIVITGGARGQGLLEARMLIERGASVVIGDVLEQEGAQAARELGERARFLRMDVSREEDWQQALAAAQDMGRVHGLINNAGIYDPHPIGATTAKNFERHFQVNQLGAFLGMKVFAGHMRAQRHGCIVNIGSAAGMRGSPNSFSYCATKWALRGMTKALAADVGVDNVRVNYVAPGPVNTAMIGFRGEQANRQRAAEVPLGRLADAEDVAPTVIFLLSDAAKYITGAEVMIDGGLYL